MVGMPARQDEAECEGRDQLDAHDNRRQIVRGAADSRDEQAEAGGRKDCAEEVEAMIGMKMLV